MAKNKIDTLPETFDSFEEMANFWDTHDLTDYEEFLTPVDMQVNAHPRHNYIIALSDTLNTKLNQIHRKEGVSLNTLVNLWVQERLQEYSTGQ